MPTSPANTTNPIFGPLSLNLRPQGRETHISFATADNKKATASEALANGHHPAIRQVQDSSARASQRAVSTPLSLMPIASQALTQAYGENHNTVTPPLETEGSDSMGRQQPKKSRKTPRPSSHATAASSKPAPAKGPDITAKSSHHPKSTAVTNSGPLVRATQPVPRAAASSAESRNARRGISTSDELSDSSDESETSDESSDEGDFHRAYHIKLLTRLPEDDDMMGIMSAPLFTRPVLEHARSLRQNSKSTPFPQYAFLAGNSEVGHGAGLADSRIFYNVASPSSIFICGQQGSGKSHTLSCLLEGCLMPSKLGRLPHPLTGIVFHYDTFVSDASGTPCEAAYLASSAKIKVRVLCAPTSIRTMKVSIA